MNDREFHFSTFPARCIMRKFFLGWLIVCATVVYGTAAPQTASAHFDIVPYVNGGTKILTGGHDDVTAEDVISLSVFGYDFGEDLLDPYFIGDPGFNNGSGFTTGLFPNNGLLPQNHSLGFDITTNLLYWDGTGAANFTPAPSNVYLGLQRGSSINLGNTGFVGGTGPVFGTTPVVGSTGTVGRVHDHVNSLLMYSTETDPALILAGSTNPTPPNAPDGIYTLGIQLRLRDSLGNTNYTSDPVFLVYNNALSEELHAEAIEWVEANLVPEPATWVACGLFALAFAGAGLRRRRTHAA
jgi:hypothetical protein